MTQAMKNLHPQELEQQVDKPKKWKELQKRALYHYDKSLDAKTPSEQTVAHRGKAKSIALQLREMEPIKATANNLLARIALDEGFYQLAEHHINEALVLSEKDAGHWYTFGHIKLAQKHFNDALTCFSNALDIKPGHTRAATSLAYTLARQGRVVEAFQAYRNLYRLHPSDAHVKEKLFEVISSIRADYYQADLEKDAIGWLKLHNVDHQALSTLVMSLLTHKYQLSDPNAVIDIQDLAKDELLKLSLEKLYFTNNDLELFIILLRKQVLLISIASQYNDNGLLQLATQIALNAEHNEHVYLYDKEETDLIQTLRELIESTLYSSTHGTEFGHLLALYGMYEPLTALNGIDQVKTTSMKDWPSYCQPLIKNSVLHRFEEIGIAQSIEQLSNIEDSVSKDVKQQYEENPYPRWLHLGYNTPTNYGRALETELAGFRAPEYFNMGKIKVLVAGAGTGRHALRVARYFRNVEVLAVDLSKRSLAYAKRMADKHDIQNIRFLCADILDFDALDEEFHVIECSGVLHHMKDPQAGLHALLRRLKPNGLIKLGLYSYQARGIVRQMRQLIQEYDLPISASGIRTMRQAILEGNMPYDFKGILSSQDFYSLSGCRDLLFHIQEHQFEPLELKEMLNQEKLKFLGFVLPEQVRQSFTKDHPEDSLLTNLDNWQEFEQKNPNTFAGMFQFYAQKPNIRRS
ncbi:methyltransferase domain-containing protein [Reinekea sp.]|jgi:2-polyprenyl-3-methyl-5-hydroxy-6-metoxy-1,4-benzoquinol methylase|uniref:methyltransferase domain-containing protein n=3 Tax=Reinekea sp. TaxID=1970455 RepID=UPI003988E5B9